MRLGSVIRRWRIMEELTLRHVGAEIGISAATLLRIEQGKLMDGEALAKILAWLMSQGEGVSRG